jgi:hypothetical protein
VRRQRIIARETGRALPCMLGDCRKPGLAEYRILVHDHPGIRNCDVAGQTGHIRFGFCSGDHMAQWRVRP